MKAKEKLQLKGNYKKKITEKAIKSSQTTMKHTFTERNKC